MMLLGSQADKSLRQWHCWLTNSQIIPLDNSNKFHEANTQNQGSKVHHMKAYLGRQHYRATRCNPGLFFHGQAFIHTKYQGTFQGTFLSIDEKAERKSQKSYTCWSNMVWRCSPLPLPPISSLCEQSRLLLKSALKNMEMSSEAGKEGPKRPSLCFQSTLIYFLSFLNQAQAAKYIFWWTSSP